MTLNIDLSNYRALVTGVSSGIGAGIADTLAQAGCDIAGCGLESADSEGAKRFVATVESYGRRAMYQSLDIADVDASRSFVHWAAAQLGGLDIVVSNAGRNFFKGVEKATDADWESNINLNLAAHWRVARAAKPYLDKSSAPVVVIITSNHAFYTMPNSFPYNVAKAGLVAMVQSLAIEWGPHIRAVGIAPGFIDTPLADAWFNEFPEPAAKRNRRGPVGLSGEQRLPGVGTPRAIVADRTWPSARNVGGGGGPRGR